MRKNNNISDVSECNVVRDSSGKFVKGSKPINGFKVGHTPWSKGTKGLKKANSGSFKEGITPWNKDLTKYDDDRVMSYVLKGAIAKKGQHCSIATEFKKGQTIGEKNNKWKGDSVGYSGIHSWLVRTFGKAKGCRNREKKVLDFSCSNLSDTYDWAKRADKEYERKKENFIELCHSCHLKYDHKQKI